MLDRLDHLVLAGPDLATAVAWFTDLTGIAPAPGGSHVGLGTANHLVGLGDDAYLEIIGPDPDQPDPPQPRPFGIDELRAPRLLTWALRTHDIDAGIAVARTGGYDPGDARAMARRGPDGTLLEWRLTPPRLDHGEGLVPFLIEWGATAHPTSRRLPQAPLLGVEARHPDPASLRPALTALGADLPVTFGESVTLTAVVRGAAGPVTV